MKIRIHPMKLPMNVLFMSILLFSCGPHENNNQIPNPSCENTAEEAIGINNLTDTMLMDGVDFPVGNPDGKGQYISKTDGKTYDSWYIATKFVEEYSLGIHPGIDLNGTGGGNTDLGQPVFAIGRGIVEEAQDFGSPWGNIVIIRHKYLENGCIKFCFSLYAHMEDVKVKKGEFVNRRRQIGEIGTGGNYSAHLHLEIRKSKMKNFSPTYWPSSNSKSISWVRDYYEDPDEFIRTHRALTCPYLESKIIIAIKNKYKLYYYEKGKLIHEYEIALSQNPLGHKEKEGDLKLPEGEYYISGKEAGPFYGDFSEYLGNRLIRISYPNVYDANIGYQKRVITKKERDNIISANEKKGAPPRNTALGGGIAIHGWNGEWIADGDQNLTWGCISMHNKDIEAFYDIVQLKTKIVITP